MQDTKYLTTEDVAKRLRIKSQKIYDIFHDPSFPSIRFGRKLLVREDKLLEWEEKLHDEQKN